MRFAIPSHDRWEVIEEKTLGTLHDLGVRSEDIDLFVAPEELPLYEGEIGHLCNVREGGRSPREQRYLMRRAYPEGEVVFFLDDDVDGIFICKGQKRRWVREITADEFLAFAEFSRKEMERAGTKLCGTCPVSNKVWMNKTVEKGLKFCPGWLYSEIIDHDPRLDTQLYGPKEDYERTLRFYKKFGAVVRFKIIYGKTKVYKTRGGLENTRTWEMEEEAVRYLKRTFPGHVKDREQESSIYPEIKLV